MSLSLTANPDELRKQFLALLTRQDVANLLDISEYQLRFHLYICPPSKRYVAFQVAKKNGGNRQILAPSNGLKIIQQKLNRVLQAVYAPKACTHGFVLSRSIVSNARTHSKKRYVLNIDLKDFFPSINFGRVRGLFLTRPYGLNSDVATILAQMCCFDNQLPQGAPTSPVISNMICAKMDTQLLRLAERYKCDYSRYADDLTFSTTLPKFPQALASVVGQSGQVEIGEELLRIIRNNGFEVNEQKVRLRDRRTRQEVTGLNANQFPNVRRRFVRQIRAMLHDWEACGFELAEEKFRRNYDKKYRAPFKRVPSFGQVVKGKIEFLGMVRGKDNPIYVSFRSKLAELAPELVREPPREVVARFGGTRLQVVTEGKTDWRHLKAALRKLRELGSYRGLEVDFLEDDDDKMGSAQLLKLCEASVKLPPAKRTVHIFDRDEPEVVKRVSNGDNTYRMWGPNCYSFAIPIPSHREGHPEISIELYYRDEEIKRKDSLGHRLYLSNEFYPESGRHITENLNCTDLQKVKRLRNSIIDDRVFSANNENVALPKSAFAENVLTGAPGFDDFDFSEFRKIFDLLESISREQ